MATDVISHFELSLDPALPEQTHDSVAASPIRRQRPLLYSFLVVLLPLLAIPAGIYLGQSDYFLNHGASIWVQSNDAVFSMRNRNCEILIFGDSTAMTGIDPSLVEKDTGLRTCNIAVTNAVLSVTDNLTLDHFLAQNGRPKILLVQLAPDSFQHANRAWDRSIYAEGMLEMMRHGTAAQKRLMLLEHPHEAITFAGYATGFSAFYALRQALSAATGLKPEDDQVHVRNGFFTPPSPARTQCDVNAQSSVDPQPAFSRQLVDDYHQQYGSQSGMVLINVAPIPACDHNLARFQQELEGVTSNHLTSLPISYFNDGRHYTASGSEVVSRLISDEVNQATGKSDEQIQQQHASEIMASLPTRAILTR